jgi:Ca2+-binding RTX toxin-like protein
MNANAIKPAACSALNLTSIIICTGTATCNGTNAKELILGTANPETIQGRGGTDCIVGGGGNDSLIGNGASDVCIGGPGTDTFTTCETQIQ